MDTIKTNPSSGVAAPSTGSETPFKLQPRVNEGVPGGGEWEAHGAYQEIQMLTGCIVLEPRPSYCDRGNWLAKVFAGREVSIDDQDGWPRYYFDEARAKAEIEAWIRKRGLWLEGDALETEQPRVGLCIRCDRRRRTKS